MVVKMDCCKTKNERGCCKDLNKSTFFKQDKQKSQRLKRGNKK